MFVSMVFLAEWLAAAKESESLNLCQNQLHRPVETAP